jgi:hypothetical protein
MIPCLACGTLMPKVSRWTGRPRIACKTACVAPARRLMQEPVDEVVVDRLCNGGRLPSTRDERIEATRLLTNLGRSASWIALLLHTTPRSITRYRHEIYQLEEAA